MASQTKAERIQELLKDPLNTNLVNNLVAADATYVSLNFDNPELKKIMPWAGTGKGPQTVMDTYRQVGQYWKNEGLEVTDTVESGDLVAVFGTFTYRSVTLGKAVTSPFCIFAKFKNDKIIYMQFMEDTFGTAATFRTGPGRSARTPKDKKSSSEVANNLFFKVWSQTRHYSSTRLGP